MVSWLGLVTHLSLTLSPLKGGEGTSVPQDWVPFANILLDWLPVGTTQMGSDWGTRWIPAFAGMTCGGGIELEDLHTCNVSFALCSGCASETGLCESDGVPVVTEVAVGVETGWPGLIRRGVV